MNTIPPLASKWKSLCLVLLCAFAFSSCFSVKSNSTFEYSKLDFENYKSMLQDSSDYYLIDVRTKGEFEKSHIPNASNFSFLRFHFRKDVKNLERHKLVFVYCETCHRSPLAARKMKKMGFRKVYDLKGGYRYWKHNLL